MKRKMSQILAIISLGFSYIFGVVPLLHAQPSIQWQKALGGTQRDRANALTRTIDGGYLVAGATRSTDGDVHGNHGSDDCWVVKLNSNGDSVWTKTLGGSSQESAQSIVETSDSGFVVAGWTTSTDGDVHGNHGTVDYWIVKLNARGDTVWTKTLGGSSNDYAFSIVQTSDNGYIVAGYTLSTDGDVHGNHGSYDYWIVRLNPTGDTVWTRTLGGSDSDIPSFIIKTTDDGCIVAGYTYSTDGDVHGNHGGDDYWIVRLNPLGDIVWTKTLGGSTTDDASSIVQTLDADYVVAGTTLSTDGDVHGNHGLVDYWIVKMNASGDTVWTKTLGGSSYDGAKSIIPSTDGGYVVAGSAQSNDGDVHGNHGTVDYWIVKLNARGDTVWTKTLGGSGGDFAQTVVQATDSPQLGYVIAGYTQSADGDVLGSGYHGGDDFWVVKLAGDVALAVSEYPNLLPEDHTVYQNYPNPFNPTTSIRYEIRHRRHVTLKIYDLLGQEIETLVNSDQVPGKYESKWSPKSLPSGVYFYRLQAGSFSETKKLILLR